MLASIRGTHVKDSRRRILALLVMLAAGVGLSACSAESVGGPSTVGEPIDEVGSGGDGGDEIRAPGRPCFLIKTELGCRL